MAKRRSRGESFGRCNFVADKVMFAPMNLRSRSLEEKLDPNFLSDLWDDFTYYVYIYHEPFENENSYFGGTLSNGDKLFLLGEPFYVGKGTRDRCFHHLNDIKKDKKRDKSEITTPFLKKLRKILEEKPHLTPKDLITVVRISKDEQEALDYETFLMKEIGSNFIDEIKDGPLMNMNLERYKIHSNGYIGSGEGNTGAKLKETEVLEIYKMLKAGKDNKEIAEIFNIDPGHVSSLRHGHRWPILFAEHFPDGTLRSNRGNKLPLESKLEILSKIKNGARNTELVKEYGCDPAVISNARYRKIWPDVWNLFDKQS